MERANGYLETSFRPGRHFSGPDDFNTQLQAWLKVANRRVHRTLSARQADRWEAVSAAAQLITTGRRRILRLARHWPWTDVITDALDRLHALPNPG